MVAFAEKQTGKGHAALASSNTQAQTALIDGFSVTFWLPIDEVCALFGSEDWVEIEGSWKGYTKRRLKGNVKVWYAGPDEQGVSVQVLGQGCRELEGSGVVKDWPQFIGGLLSQGGRFSRLDVALDDYKGHIQRHAVEQAINEARVVSRYKDITAIEKRSLADGVSSGWTAYFGSVKSETMIRVYDKRAEQLAKGNEAPAHWMRVELQARRERAHELARVIVEHGMKGVSSVVRGLLEFKQQGTHSQRERWPSMEWWSRFLEDASKLRLTVAPIVRTIAEVKNWFSNSISSMLAVLACHEEAGERFINECIDVGVKRWKNRHKLLVMGT